MDLAQIATNILEYLAANAGKGNTRALVSGAGTVSSIMVVADRADQKKRYPGVASHRVVTLEQVAEGILLTKGVKGFPLVVDNGALKVLLAALVEKKAKKIAKKKESA